MVSVFRASSAQSAVEPICRCGAVVAGEQLWSWSQSLSLYWWSSLLDEGLFGFGLQSRSIPQAVKWCCDRIGGQFSSSGGPLSGECRK